MGGETEKSVSAWTIDSLHSHMISLLADRELQTRSDRDADLRHLASVVNNIETRFDGMDKANEVLAYTVNRVPTDVDRQVGQLKAVHDEHFKSVEAAIADLSASMGVRFQERDTRSEREARDNKIAVDAAFAAAKEAVAENNKSSALANDKSEATFTKQIDGIQLLIATTNKATDEKISDLKDQLSSRRGRDLASGESRTDRRGDYAVVLAGLSVIVSIVVAIVLIIHG